MKLSIEDQIFSLPKVNLEDARYWSNFQKLSVKLRKDGITIDLDAVNDGIAELKPDVENMKHELQSRLKIKNLQSTKQLPQALIALGYDVPKTEKGNLSANGKWLKENKDDELIRSLLDYRSGQKILRDFLLKIKDIQKYTDTNPISKYGKIYSEIKIFGATKTGRMSSANPNEQNIPKRNKLWAKLVRRVIVPDPGNTLFTLDYSNQEGRLQVHYGVMLGCKDAKVLADKMWANPWLDLHKMTYSNMYSVEYENVTKDNKDFIKPVNLGISYGMQSGSLALALNLPTKIITTENGYKLKVAGDEAMSILNRHKFANNYVYVLIDKCKKTISERGYIQTLLKRRLYKDKIRAYTAISKTIQGSAADLLYMSWLEAEKQGIKVLLLVHDEAVIQGTVDDARKMKYIMENVIELKVPMKVEVHQGKSWGDLEKIDLDNLRCL